MGNSHADPCWEPQIIDLYKLHVVFKISSSINLFIIIFWTNWSNTLKYFWGVKKPSKVEENSMGAVLLLSNILLYRGKRDDSPKRVRTRFPTPLWTQKDYKMSLLLELNNHAKKPPKMCTPNPETCAKRCQKL